MLAAPFQLHAVGYLDHVHRLVHLAIVEKSGIYGLVRIAQCRAHDLQMPVDGRNIIRLYAVVRIDFDDVARLIDLDQVCHVLERAFLHALVQRPDIYGPDGRTGRVLPGAEIHIVLGIASGKYEMRRRALQCLAHLRLGEVDLLAVYLKAVLGKYLQHSLTGHMHTVLCQQLQ